MNQSLLHFIEAVKKNKNKLNEQYLDEITQSSKMNGQNFRYLTLLLIKIWNNNSEFLGYRFNQWFQAQKKNVNPKNGLELLKSGQVHQCIQNYESKLPRNTFEMIKKHNFFPKLNSQLQEESFRKVQSNQKMYDDHVLNTINKILSGNLETIKEVSKKDWESFIMLYVQFYDYKVTPLQMTKILNEQYFYEDDDQEDEKALFKKIVFNPQFQSIVQYILDYDKCLAYFVYIFFEAQGETKLRSQNEIQTSKFLLISKILEELDDGIQNETEILFFFDEITEILKQFIRDLNYKDLKEKFSQIFSIKGEQVIASCNDFNQILEFIEKLEKYQQQDSFEQILNAILNKLFAAQQLANSENALNILVEKYVYENNFINVIKQAMNENMDNNQYDNLFRNFIKNFSLKQYHGFFEQELMKLSFKFGLRLNDLQQVNQIDNPEFLILNISKEFISNVMQMDEQFKLKIKIILSNLLDSCKNQEDKLLENRKNIVRLLIRRL